MRRIPTNKGFSLVELLVIIVIFMTITSVVLFNQNKFSSDISNANVTYAIALEIRQAQVYGTLVRSNTVASQPFDIGYGINFYKPTASTIAFRLIADNNNDFKYSSGTDTIVNSFNLEEGNVISEVCTYPQSGSLAGAVCMIGGSSVSTSTDIVFKRPDPAAIISNSRSTGSGATLAKSAETKITVTSALKDKTKVITVTQTGQISVQ